MSWKYYTKATQALRYLKSLAIGLLNNLLRVTIKKISNFCITGQWLVDLFHKGPSNMESIRVSFYHNEAYGFSSSPLVPHICLWELGQHWFRWWLVAWSVPSHYLNQCWNIVNWTLRSKLQWNSNQNTNFFLHEIAFENVAWEMAAILSRGKWVNYSSPNEVVISQNITWLKNCKIWCTLNCQIQVVGHIQV